MKLDLKEVCSKYFTDVSEAVMDIVQVLFVQSADWVLESGLVGELDLVLVHEMNHSSASYGIRAINCECIA